MPQYRLIGTGTSPYVRRLRLYMHGIPHDFDPLKDMYGQDDEQLSTQNPMKRVPVMLIDGRPLWESRVIFNHVRSALGRPALAIEDENTLSTVDALQDQLIQGFLMKRYRHPIFPENDYFLRHADRQRRMLAFLRESTLAARFDTWTYPTMSLYCLLDWADFRNLLAPEEINGPLTGVLEFGRSQPLVAETDPRRA